MNSDNPHYAQTLEALSRSPLFEELPQPLLEKMLRAVRHETWSRRSSAMGARHTLDRFFVIVSGRLMVSRTNPSTGREVSLLLLEPGDAFDVTSLLDGKAQDFTTRAIDDLHAVSVPLAVVREWIECHPAFNRALLSYLGRQMRDLLDLSASLALSDTETRFANLLLRHVDPEHPHDPPSLISDLSHETLASMIGSVRAVTNRHVQHLKREGLIATRRGQLTITDIDGLAARCDRAECFGTPRGRLPRWGALRATSGPSRERRH